MSADPRAVAAPLSDRFRTARLPAEVVHLDSAAAGRSSAAVLAAVREHADREVRRGAYTAAAEAGDVLDTAREQVLDLLGGGSDAALAFVNAATDGLTRIATALLDGPDARAAGVLRAGGEYGPNIAVWRALGAADREVDLGHHLDATALDAALRAHRPAFVHLTWVGSHVGTVQDLAPLLAVAREHGVPSVVDAAQAFAHVDTSAARGADAVYGTSRKWLTGPRGVGFLALRGRFVPLAAELEPSEGHHAGRVGFARAVADLHESGPDAVVAGLAAVGARTRAALADVAGWQVVEAIDEPSATTTLRPTAGQDVATVRARLLAAGIVTTAALRVRSPEMTTDVLRISPHLDVSTADLDALVRALPTGADGESLPE